jgi:probable addiction module antidote protein
MPIETKPWDAAEVLNTPADIAAYLDAYLEDGSSEELLRALGTIARSHGMAALARETGIVSPIDQLTNWGHPAGV